MFKILLIKVFIIITWQCKKDDMEDLKLKQNQLKDSQSPYLLQHASNPVDWFPRGESAFKKANEENKPIILMGYYNMIFQYNENKFIDKCKKCKVDGLIVVDLPFPENKKFAYKCKKKNINFIQLISPTTSKKRLRQIVKISHDMIYYISMLSTTGGKLKVSSKKILEEYTKIKKQNKSKNVVIGFGITEKTINSLKKADGLVVGSAICKVITSSIKRRQNAVTNVTNVVRRLKNKIK